MRAKLTRMPFDLRDHPWGFLTPIQVPDAPPSHMTPVHPCGITRRDVPDLGKLI
jgi:hypothetical protein